MFRTVLTSVALLVLILYCCGFLSAALPNSTVRLPQSTLPPEPKHFNAVKIVLPCPVTDSFDCTCGCVEGEACSCAVAKRMPSKAHAKSKKATDGGPNWSWDGRKRVWFRYRSQGNCGPGGCSTGR